MESGRRELRVALGLFVVALVAAACGPKGGRGDMPPGWSEAVEDAERRTLRVVVFCDVAPEGERVLALLRDAGYTNPGNYVHPSPNDDFNIKWGEGGASSEAVAELAAIVERAVDHRLDRKPVFEPGDQDVFVNLPLGRVARHPAGGTEAPAPLQPGPARHDKGDQN